MESLERHLNRRRIIEVVGSVIAAIVVIVLITAGLKSGIQPDELQLETIRILNTITGCSILYCFFVGELSRNNSQMDKLWSILPIIYAIVTLVKGSWKPRLIIMTCLVLFWGVRLTINFAKKGAYSIRFWSGEEDYRWSVLRKNRILGKKWVWAMFDLLFISAYQNILVLLICMPMVACMSSEAPVGAADILSAVLTLFFILYETIADRQQMRFQTEKWRMIKAGKKLSELPAPYNKGFNTTGLWGVSRHPNYFAEQAIWVSLYLFCIAANVTERGLHCSIVGSMLLILLFMGSSTMAEIISSGKYPEYKDYQKNVSKYLPFFSHRS